MPGVTAVITERRPAHCTRHVRATRYALDVNLHNNHRPCAVFSKYKYAYQTQKAAHLMWYEQKGNLDDYTSI